MMRLRLLWVSLISLVALCSATSSTGSKVLVILEPTLKKDSFSTFFGGLEGMYLFQVVTYLSDLATARGYQLTIREPKADAPLLVQYDVPQFSHVIFFAPTTKCEWSFTFSYFKCTVTWRLEVTHSSCRMLLYTLFISVDRVLSSIVLAFYKPF